MTTRALSLALLLTALAMHCCAQDAPSLDTELADCQPDTLPDVGANNDTMVTLQMHQWIWIQNLTDPDWAPRSDGGGMFYESLRPGYVRQQGFLMKSTLLPGSFVYVNASFVTNGEGLCAAALTQYRNATSGDLNRVSCSRVCQHNFTSTKTRLKLPLMVLDDWVTMSRNNEYLVFDAVDPDSRAAYTCLGYFKSQQMSTLPRLLSLSKPCPEGDECLFNWNTNYIFSYISAGCKTDFFEYNWCVSDPSICTYNIDGDCPVCCRGDLCNKEVAQKAYKRWLDSGSGASQSLSLLLLTASAVSLLTLRLHQ